MRKKTTVIRAGTVRYGSQRAAAESAVATLTGVRSVRDDIEISCDAGSVDVLTAVQDALDRATARGGRPARIGHFKPRFPPHRDTTGSC